MVTFKPTQRDNIGTGKTKRKCPEIVVKLPERACCPLFNCPKAAQAWKINPANLGRSEWSDGSPGLLKFAHRSIKTKRTSTMVRVNQCQPSGRKHRREMAGEPKRGKKVKSGQVALGFCEKTKRTWTHEMPFSIGMPQLFPGVQTTIETTGVHMGVAQN